MLSYWEKQSLLHYDVIIVGSGIVGLSTALSIKERDAAKRILVLERGILPTGASTKNAGFACIGSLTEILDDLDNMSADEVLQLVEMRYRGLQKLRARLGEENMGYAENGSYELIGPNEEYALDNISRINQMLQPVLGQPAFSMANQMLPAFGFDKNKVKHLVRNNMEGELNTGKMMRALIDLCLVKGIEIKTGAEALKVEENGNAVMVPVNHPLLSQQVVFTAPKVVICTNAFTRHFYPLIDVQPGRGLVLVTKPIEGLKFSGIFHFNKGYYYFRRLGNRVLFGGGRNMDIEGERTTGFEINEAIRADLLLKLANTILPGARFEIEDWWTGIMAFGAAKFPVLMRQSPCIWLGVRMGGMGVAIGSQIGEQLAQMVLEG